MLRVRNDFLDDIKYAWNRIRENILTIKIKTSGQKYHKYKWKDKSWQDKDIYNSQTTEKAISKICIELLQINFKRKKKIPHKNGQSVWIGNFWKRKQERK